MSGPGTLRRHLLHGGAALAVGTALAAGAWSGYRYLLAQPLKRVVFAGDVDRLPHAELDALSRAVQASGPDGVSLAAVREAAKQVPWVRDATVRRRFPDIAEITFEAHEAFARWNDGALVSRHGEVFVAPNAGELPMLRGPEGAGPLMAAEYPALAQALAPLGALSELRLSPRGAWQAALANGLVIELGRAETRTRAAGFVAAWAKLPPEAQETKHADLRYPNGFALRMARVTPAPAPQGRPEKGRRVTPSPTLPQGGGRTSPTLPQGGGSKTTTLPHGGGRTTT